MTTAARPTFEPARGGRGKGEGDLSQLSKQYSSRDLPSHTKIKYRQTTQDAPEEVRNRDFRRELEERERAAAREKNRDRPTREHTTSSSVSKKPRLDQIPAANLDADDPLTDEEDEDEDFEEESDDDDTAALLAELEKIKKERAEEQARKEQEQKAEEERIRMENILSGNPLLNLTGPAQPQTNFKVKRRWDDDVVFKNCAKGVDDQKKDKRGRQIDRRVPPLVLCHGQLGQHWLSVARLHGRGRCPQWLLEALASGSFRRFQKLTCPCVELMEVHASGYQVRWD